MSDTRLGRRAPVQPGPQQMQSVRRRPQFQDNDGGDTFEADAAADLARSEQRSDLRGPVAPAPPGDYAPINAKVAENRERQVRRRGAQAAEEQGETNPRAERSRSRDPREYGDRQFSEDRELTDDERVAMLRTGFFQVALPDLPKKSGLHRVWLTTTNTRDPVAARLRAGYRLLRHEDLGPGWEQHKATSAEYAGCVMINEMIAAEISAPLYQRYMTELHHNMPRERERGIYGRLDAHNEALKGRGSRLIYENEEENPLAPHARGNVRAPREGFE